MKYISEYKFTLQITGLQPKNQMIWMTYQFGEAITDFYAARMYSTAEGVGGALAPILTVTAASTFQKWFGYPTEVHIDITGLPNPPPLTAQRVAIEMDFAGATGNNATMIYHNVTQNGPVSQIDCLCRFGGAGGYSAFSCYNTYIGDYDD